MMTMGATHRLSIVRHSSSRCRALLQTPAAAACASHHACDATGRQQRQRVTQDHRDNSAHHGWRASSPEEYVLGAWPFLGPCLRCGRALRHDATAGRPSRHQTMPLETTHQGLDLTNPRTFPAFDFLSEPTQDRPSLHSPAAASAAGMTSRICNAQQQRGQSGEDDTKTATDRLPTAGWACLVHVGAGLVLQRDSGDKASMNLASWMGGRGTKVNKTTVGQSGGAAGRRRARSQS